MANRIRPCRTPTATAGDRRARCRGDGPARALGHDRRVGRDRDRRRRRPLPHRRGHRRRPIELPAEGGGIDPRDRSPRDGATALGGASSPSDAGVPARGTGESEGAGPAADDPTGGGVPTTAADSKAEEVPAVIVFDREGGLTPDDLNAIGPSAAASTGSASPARRRSSTPSPPRRASCSATSPTTPTASARSPRTAKRRSSSSPNAADHGAISNGVDQMREYLAAHPVPGLHAYVTGPAGIAADLDKVANEVGRTLLIATLGLVLLLLLLVYRAPLCTWSRRPSHRACRRRAGRGPAWSARADGTPLREPQPRHCRCRSRDRRSPSPSRRPTGPARRQAPSTASAAIRAPAPSACRARSPGGPGGSNLAADQAKTVAALRIDRQHGVQQHAVAAALAISPSPRRRLAEVRKLISLVSWIASTCRPVAATAVCTPSPRSGGRPSPCRC